jgi:hypothetical protein
MWWGPLNPHTMDNVCHWELAAVERATACFFVTVLQPDLPAFFIASTASAMPGNGVVFTFLQAPPPATALANAAAVTLSGISITPSRS